MPKCEEEIGVFVVVSESFDGCTAIGKILESSGVLLVSSSNVSKESVGTDYDKYATLLEVPRLT